MSFFPIILVLLWERTHHLFLFVFAMLTQCQVCSRQSLHIATLVVSGGAAATGLLRMKERKLYCSFCTDAPPFTQHWAAFASLGFVPTDMLNQLP